MVQYHILDQMVYRALIKVQPIYRWSVNLHLILILGDIYLGVYLLFHTQETDISAYLSCANLYKMYIWNVICATVYALICYK